METWDKLYIKLKDLLECKNSTAEILWILAFSSYYSTWKINLLHIWKTEVLHFININKLLQSLGYAQIKLFPQTTVEVAESTSGITDIINQKEKWQPILEKTTQENFGTEIYYTLGQIIADDLVNIEVLKELQKELEGY